MKKDKQSESDERIRILNERTAKLQAEAAQLDKENAEQWKKTEKKFEEVAELQRENSVQIKANVEGLREIRIGLQEANKRIDKTDKQIGGLGNKFGDYTEAMARPSIRRLLEQRFEADFQGSIRLIDTKDALDLEVDAWGVSRNGTGAAYIVETKSKFRDKHIEQVWQLVERFRIHYSEYWERAVYPMLAVVDISDEGRRKVWNAGIHLIEINDGVFQYAKPPKGFEANGYHGMHGVQRDVPQLRVVAGRDHKRRGAG